jgi:hypothetical protein
VSICVANFPTFPYLAIRVIAKIFLYVLVGVSFCYEMNYPRSHVQIFLFDDFCLILTKEKGDEMHASFGEFSLRLTYFLT